MPLLCASSLVHVCILHLNRVQRGLATTPLPADTAVYCVANSAWAASNAWRLRWSWCTCPPVRGGPKRLHGRLKRLTPASRWCNSPLRPAAVRVIGLAVTVARLQWEQLATMTALQLAEKLLCSCAPQLH